MDSPLHRQLISDLDRAFPTLVDRYGSMIVSLSSRMTDTATGEDITQEVFLRAYRALESYEPDQVAEIDFRPWLATIARNLVRNEYRRRSRKPAVPLTAESSTQAMKGPATTSRAGPTDQDTPAARLDEQESLDRIDVALEHLSTAQREAVVLRHIAGLPVREIALTLDCPEGTVKSHLSRGLAELRKRLEPDFDELTPKRPTQTKWTQTKPTQRKDSRR